METDYEILARRVTLQRSSLRRRQKAMYRLAKELGFSTSEAVVLQNWSESRVRAVAERRAKNAKD